MKRAGDRHDPAALQIDRQPSLSDGAEGTLTIKPDGFKIKVRPRTDKERGAFSGHGTATAAVSTGAPAPRTRARPGHNTPLLVLYGSNLGTAEELQRVLLTLPRSTDLRQNSRRSMTSSANCRSRAAS